MKYIKFIIKGMAIGSLIMTLISIFLVYFVGTPFETLLANNFIPYSIAAMVIGIGFYFPSIIYDNDDLSLLVKSVIHMGIGMTIYIITSIAIGWIPIYGLGALITGIIISLIFAIVIWLGFYLYYKKEAYKKEATDINKHIQKNQK